MPAPPRSFLSHPEVPMDSERSGLPKENPAWEGVGLGTGSAGVGWSPAALSRGVPSARLLVRVPCLGWGTGETQGFSWACRVPDSKTPLMREKQPQFW